MSTESVSFMEGECFWKVSLSWKVGLSESIGFPSENPQIGGFFGSRDNAYQNLDTCGDGVTLLGSVCKLKFS